MDYEALITVTIRDTVTGVEVTSDKYPFYWWSDGNGSCDCNRELLFGHETETNGICLGSRRYVIVKTSAGDLSELNSDYPEALL